MWRCWHVKTMRGWAREIAVPTVSRCSPLPQFSYTRTCGWCPDAAIVLLSDQNSIESHATCSLPRHSHASTGLSLEPLILGSLGPQAKTFWGPGQHFGVPFVISGKHTVHVFVLELTFKHFWHLLSQNIGYNLVNTSLPNPGTKLPGLGHVSVVKIPVSSYTRSNELPINKMSLIDKTCQLLAHWMSQLLKICPVLVIEFYS